MPRLVSDMSSAKCRSRGFRATHSGRQIESDERPDRIHDADRKADGHAARRVAIPPMGDRGQDAGNDRAVGSANASGSSHR